MHLLREYVCARTRARARACVHRIPAHVHMMNMMMHLQWMYIFICI
jgi:hypothetical protein